MKDNNRYYANIEIDDNALRSLPDDGPVDRHLPQLRDLNDRLRHVEDGVGDDRLDHDTEDTIVRNFILAPLPSHGEDRTIDDALGRMQSNNHPVMWPNLGINAINEFNTPGYIARAFPVLYPTGSADLRAEHARDVNPSEYFQHLLRYKDGRFGRHPRWRYFALNSQMRWRALQEGKVYVK